MVAFYSRPFHPITPLRGVVRCFGLQRESVDAIRHQTRVEVHQQANTLMGHSHVVQDLRFEDWCESLDGLDFDYHAVFNNDVDHVLTKQPALIVCGDPLLTLVAQSFVVQLNAQCGFVRTLQ